jgi:hypothetical protein
VRSRSCAAARAVARRRGAAGLTAGTGCTRIDNALASVPVFAFMRNAPSFDPYEHPLPPAPGAIPFESPSGPVLPPLEATEQALRRSPPAVGAESAGRRRRRGTRARPASCTTGTAPSATACRAAATARSSVRAVPARAVARRSTGDDAARRLRLRVIRAGRGLMPAYGARMTHMERWAVVNYVNHAAGAAGVTQPQPRPQPRRTARLRGPRPAAGGADTVPPQQ